MKQLLPLLLLLLPFTLCAQSIFQDIPVDSATGQIVYQGVVQVPGIKQAELYTRARAWAAQTFSSAKNVIQMDDREAGILIIRSIYGANFDVFTSRTVNYIWHTTKIETKDGRYRYTLDDFHVEKGSGMMFTAPDMATQIRVASKTMGNGFKKGRPGGMYKVLMNGVKEPSTIELSTLQTAMTPAGIKAKDF